MSNGFDGSWGDDAGATDDAVPSFVLPATIEFVMVKFREALIPPAYRAELPEIVRKSLSGRHWRH